MEKGSCTWDCLHVSQLRGVQGKKHWQVEYGKGPCFLWTCAFVFKDILAYFMDCVEESAGEVSSNSSCMLTETMLPLDAESSRGHAEIPKE